MRRPEYLSPSALACYTDHGAEEFYLRYLAENRPPRLPQTKAMAVGSSFDAYVKSHIYHMLFGARDPKYTFEALFEAQVESQCRDDALAAGKYIFDEYVQSGALADLMQDVSKSLTEPRFEFDLKGAVRGSRESTSSTVGDVVILGKPDLYFINEEGAHVIHDWKVNGFYSSNPVSPKPGYVRCKEWDGEFGCWLRAKGHKDAVIESRNGIEINTATNLEMVDESWAIQLSAYGWLMGEPVGHEIINSVDQVACNPKKKKGQFPSLRFAAHRVTTSQAFQNQAHSKFQNLWNLIYEEPFHFFRELSLEESQAKCKLLDSMGANICNREANSELENAIYDWSRRQ